MSLIRVFFFSTLLGLSVSSFADTTPVDPTQFLTSLSTHVLDEVNASSELDKRQVQAVVEKHILPFADFSRMTASSVGPAWRQATPEQKERLIAEFRTVLTRTYSGAVREMKGRRVVVKNTASLSESEVVVRTEVIGRGEPLQIEYKMARQERGASIPWKIYDLNVMGIWLVSTYRSQFSAEISARGIEGLIQALHSRNNI